MNPVHLCPVHLEGKQNLSEKMEVEVSYTSLVVLQDDPENKVK